MADPTTPNYGFTLPTVGLDRDSWGDLLNANWSKVDADLAAVSNVAYGNAGTISWLINAVRSLIEPIGSIKPWPAPNAPAGWFPCDGWEISRTDYAELFAVIGGYWGVGNGSTTFNIPNLQGFTLVHRGSWMGFASFYGETSHVLSYAEMPTHRHGGNTDTQGYHQHLFNHSHLIASPGLAGGSNINVADEVQALQGAGDHSHNIVTDWQGNGYAHNNVQPSVGVLWIIKAVNVI